MAQTKLAGTWVYEDLFSLPDDGRRYEIIEGELYEMPAPNWAHSTVIANLITMLIPLVARLGGVWRTAPLMSFSSAPIRSSPISSCFFPAVRRTVKHAASRVRRTS